jgi:hypothetical protein
MRRLYEEGLRKASDPASRERLRAQLAKPVRRGDEFADEFREMARSANIPLQSHETEGAAPLVGDFLVPLAQVTVPALGGVIIGWLQGRAGRKVRVKFGDTEAEARTPEDLKRILELVEEHKAKAPSGAKEEKP